MANQTTYLSGAALKTLCKYLKDSGNSEQLVDFLESKKEITGAKILEAENLYPDIPKGAYDKFCEAVNDLHNSAWNKHKCKKQEDEKDCSLIAEEYAWEFGKQIGI